MLCRLLPLLLLLCLPLTLPAADPEEGFVPLFNGKDLTGWKAYGKAELWTVEDGKIVNTASGGGWLGTTRDYANYHLKLDYRLKPGGNSGVYLRAPEEGHISRVGMEIQLLDDDHPSYAKLQPYQYTGSLYHVVAAKPKTCKPAGEWNSIEIRAEGRKLTVIHNGTKILETDLDEAGKEEAVAKEHPGLKRTTGRIGLQSHTDRLEFKNLRIKELK
jgi:hypothetical protein